MARIISIVCAVFAATASVSSAWPTSKGSVRFNAPKIIKKGETFDGGMKTYQRSDIKCGGQSEGTWKEAVFKLEPGAKLKNVIIGPDQREGVHCDDSDCTVENVWWEDVCEDALSVKGGNKNSVTNVLACGAKNADDKIIQHNGLGHVNINGFYAENFGKLYRSCGTCGNKKRTVSLNHVWGYNPKVSLVTVNANNGDVATFTNDIHVHTSKGGLKGIRRSMTLTCFYHFTHPNSTLLTHHHNYNSLTTPTSSTLHNNHKPLFHVFQGILRPTIRSFSTKITSSCKAMANFDSDSVTYLKQQEAAEIDETLMGPLGFSVDQLMELAGLSVATSIYEVYKPGEYSRVLIVCGPGNNGGDGLVAARHLHHFGYKLLICYPKRTPKPLYAGLVTQLEALSIPFLSVEDLPSDFSKDYDILVDAMFGFSFHGSPRPPFDDLIQRLVSLSNHNQTGLKRPVIVSVDIPSGWHVEEGDVNDIGFKPDMLISLTAPKLCAKKFGGPHHFLGGRFVPPAIAEKYKLILPPYPGTSTCVRIGKPPQIDISALRENYISPEFLEDQVEANPFNQFRKWFDDALAASLKEPNAMALSTVGKDGKPSSRIVLLKGFDNDGFVWFTNYESQKGRALSENPHASILFYWDGLNRQVRVEGYVQKISEEESEQYFHSRPRGSQIGAIVSKQSSVVPGRHVLHEQYKELEQKYADGSVIPKPKNWGGYRLTPHLFEFWQGQKSRLHDRLQYVPHEIDGQKLWKVERLAP